MNIRPRNIPKFDSGGVTGVGRTSDNWYNDVHLYQMQAILDRLLEYGDADDYMNWLNSMLHAHSYIWYNNKDKMNKPVFDRVVLNYLRAYSGDNNYYPYISPEEGEPDRQRWLLREGTNDNYNNYGIKSSFDNGVFTYPGKRTSKDNPEWNYNPDGYFSGITDYRRLLGRKGDYTDEQLTNFRNELNKRGYDIYEDTKDNGYYKLKRLAKNETPGGSVTPLLKKTIYDVPTGHNQKYGFDWNKFNEGLSKIFNNPDLYSVGRFAGSIIANNKIYDEALKGIRPNLMLSYKTHRQVVGDEATKQAYYRRAVLGLTKAAQPFTSDADRLVAYMQEAKRVGDELRAQGDLADNLEIRRTSDESSQHLWANAQRATEVANANNASINQANSLKHNLLALKHAAQWSSVDNFLKEVEYRKRQQIAEDQAIDEQIWTLGLDNVRYTPEYINAYKKYNDTLEKHKKSDGTYDEYNPEVMNAVSELLNVIKKYRILQLQDYKNYRRSRNVLTAKSGTKVTYKKKDDLLYKSGRDVVEHFRRMSKMSSDAQNRKTPKIEKLTSHPKSGRKAWKFLQGGLAPFVVYTPLSMGGETSRTTSSDSSSTKSSSSSKGGKSDVLDMIKELFKEVVGKGLPSDVNSLYTSMLNFLSRSRMFGDELSTDDIASMYVSLMLKLNQIQHLKGIHDKAEQAVILNDAVNEYAVDFAGRLVAKDDDDNIVYVKSLKDALDKGVTPLTNAQLLQLRSTLPSLAGRLELDSIAANGIGMSKIAQFLKSLLPTIGSSESTIEGYTKKESNLIKAGLQLLRENPDLYYAPDGEYEYSKYTKDQLTQVKIAMNYLKGILPNNMKKIIEVRAEQGNLSVDLLIGSLIGSGISEESRLQFTPVTGKGASSNKEGKDSTSSEGLKLDAVTALISGKGYKSEIELNPGSNYAVTVNGRYSGFLKKSGENMGSGISMQEATTSTLDEVLDWNKATIGGSRIISTALSQVILNSSEVVGMDLPVDPNNPDTPNFEILKQLENLDKLLKLNNIEDNELNWQKVNELCEKLNIPKKYDSSGKLNKMSWKRFAAFLVTIPDTALVNKNVILDTLGVANELERELYNTFIQQKTKDKNFELSDTTLGFGHRDELYKGTVFVPIKESMVAAAISGGLNIYMTLATDLELKELGYDTNKVQSYKKPEYNL